MEYVDAHEAFYLIKKCVYSETALYSAHRANGITLCLIWDFTCVNRLAMSNVARGTFPGPTIADKAVEAKRMKYESLTRNYIFQPVAVKHLGDLGTDTDDFLKQLCRQIIAETNDKRAGTFLR